LTLFKVTVSNARLLSALFSLMGLVIFYKLALLIFENKSIALISSAFLSIHPIFLHYAHTVRAYALTMLLVLSFVYLFLKYFNDKKEFKKYILLGGITGVLMLTHYLSIQVVVFIVIWYFVFYYKELKDFIIIRNWIISVAIFFLLVGVWYYFYGSEGTEIMAAQNEIIRNSVAPEFKPTFKGLVFGVLSQTTAIFGNYLGMIGFKVREVIFLLIFPLIIIVFGLFKGYKSIKKEYVYLIVGMVVFNLFFDILLAINSGHNVSFWPRYTVFSVPFACLLLGLSAVYIFQYIKLVNATLVLSMAFLILTMVVSSLPAYTGYLGSYDLRPELRSKIYSFSFTEYKKEPYEALAEKINNVCREGDTIYFKSFEHSQNINLYLRGRNDLIQLIDSNQVEAIKFKYNRVEEIESPHLKY